MKKQTQNALMYAGGGAVVGFAAAKLMKAKTKTVVMVTLGLALVGGIVGYKKS